MIELCANYGKLTGKTSTRRILDEITRRVNVAVGYADWSSAPSAEAQQAMFERQMEIMQQRYEERVRKELISTWSSVKHTTT